MKAGKRIGIPISLHPAFRYLEKTEGGERERAASADDKFRKAVSPSHSFVKSHL
jgi:hypothetical protein